MSGEQQASDLIAVKLDAERRREIDDVKKRMEEFLREQINVTNELKIVAKGQDQLKERFEMGVAKTLVNLDKKFDTFMIEWGKKQAEDLHRDEKIADTRIIATSAVATSEKANERVDGIITKFAYTLFGSLALVAVIWALSLVLKHGGG